MMAFSVCATPARRCFVVFEPRVARRTLWLRGQSQTMFTTRALNVLKCSPSPTTVFILPTLQLLEFRFFRTTHDLGLGLNCLYCIQYWYCCNDAQLPRLPHEQENAPKMCSCCPQGWPMFVCAGHPMQHHTKRDTAISLSTRIRGLTSLHFSQSDKNLPTYHIAAPECGKRHHTRSWTSSLPDKESFLQKPFQTSLRSFCHFELQVQSNKQPKPIPVGERFSPSRLMVLDWKS